MDYRKVILSSLLVVSGFAHSGYAELATPERFSGSPGNWKFSPSANDVRYGKVAFQQNGFRVPVPGSTVTMPAAYRFAANAPRIAAAVVSINPYLRAAVGIATWLGVAGLVWDSVNETWSKQINIMVSTKQWYSGYAWFNSASEACNSWAGEWTSQNGSGMYSMSSNGVTGDICKGRMTQEGKPPTYSQFTMQTRMADVAVPELIPVSPKDAEDSLDLSPMPDSVPWELPFPTPLPVDQPFINPSPGTSPEHRPLFVPTGNPLPNPAYDPNAAPGPGNQPYYQPGVRVTPSPTVDKPTRVDIIPVDRPQSSPDVDPNPNPDTPPDPNNPDNPKPEEQQSLCEKHPEIVACQKLGSLSPEVLQKKTVPLTITKEDGFGPATGACPAPKTFVIMGKPMAFRWDLLCDFASQIRPLLVGFAYLSAALAFMGLSRKD